VVSSKLIAVRVEMYSTMDPGVLKNTYEDDEI
jgi:hypothetical protein